MKEVYAPDSPAPIDVLTTGQMNLVAIADEARNGGAIDFSNPETAELVKRLFPN